MNETYRNLTIAKKLKNIISKYYPLEVFKEVNDSFYPICIIKLDDSIPPENFVNMQSELKTIGFQAKFLTPKKAELKESGLKYEEAIKRYFISFEAKIFIEPAEKKKRDTKIQVILLGATSFLIIISAFFYIIYIEPYYGIQYKKDPNSTISLILLFCIGMFSIIVVHEFGHVILARHHKLDTSFPFLIPGPPPIGMLGAFVKIKDDPQTRNQKFDLAVGGIIFGIIISLIFVIIGLYISEYVDTNTYINLRTQYSGKTSLKEAQNISEDLNLFNLLFLGLRTLIFEAPTYSTYFGYTLPDKILIIHPLCYTGWIGLLLSCLNLLPIPFLDGGHALKAVFPGRYTRIIGLLIGGIVYIILTRQISSFFLIFLTISCVGIVGDLDLSKRHATVPNPTEPLSKSRKIFAVCLLVFIVLLFPVTFDNLLYGIGF